MSKKNNRDRLLFVFFVSFIGLIFFVAFWTYEPPLPKAKMQYYKLLDEINNNSHNIINVEISDSYHPKKAIVDFVAPPFKERGMRSSTKFEVHLLSDNAPLINALINKKVRFYATDIEEKQNDISVFRTLILLALLLSFIFFGPRLFGFSSSGIASIFGGNTRKKNTSESDIKFADVYGIDSIKEEVMEVVDFLRNPQKYSAIGAKMPRGILFSGEPGVGKTMLAKAVANEAKAKFISCAASEFVEVYVGLGAKRVRDLFAEAKNSVKAGEACIIFIDELDAIGGKRSSSPYGGNTEREQTLNQILVEIDGFDSETGIVVIGATNRPDVLDSALIRPGRFDRKIEIPLPNIQARLDIFKGHLKGVTTDPNGVNLEGIVKSTAGLAGADIAGMVNEAALKAVKANRAFINMNDLDEALEDARMGRKSILMCSEEERKKTAYHEAGHAILIVLLNDPNNPTASPDPIFKGTTISRGRALGYVSFFPQGDYDVTSQTKAKVMNDICVAMGGKVAEEIIYGDENVTSGATGDIKAVTSMALAWVSMAGASKVLGHVSLEFLVQKGYKESLVNSELLAEVRDIIEEQYNRAKKILQMNKEIIKLLGDALLERETMSGEEITYLIKTGKLEGFKETFKSDKAKYIYYPPDVSEKNAQDDVLEKMKEILSKEALKSVDNSDLTSHYKTLNTDDKRKEDSAEIDLDTNDEADVNSLTEEKDKKNEAGKKDAKKSDKKTKENVNKKDEKFDSD